MLPRIQILQHDNHRIHAAEQCWAAMYNFTDFIFLLIYLLIFLFSCWFDTLKAMWNNAVSFIFAGCVVRVFLFYFETFSVHVLAFFKNATFICFSRDRMVYRNTHQHVCVPFFFACMCFWPVSSAHSGRRMKHQMAGQTLSNSKYSLIGSEREIVHLKA